LILRPMKAPTGRRKGLLRQLSANSRGLRRQGFGHSMSALSQAVHSFRPTARSKRVGPIGLECSLHELHLVQLEATPTGAIALRARASVPYPVPRDELLRSPKQMRSLVRRALASDRFHGRRVVSVLPSPQTRILSVTYQVHAGHSDAASLLKVMAGRLEEELSRYVIDYLPVRAEKQVEERLAIVAVAKRESVIDYLELLRECGLEAVRLDIGPAAIRRLVSVMAPRGTHDNVLAINFGRETSYLTAISGARLLFDQEVRFGEQRLLDAIAAALEMSVEAAGDLVKRHSLDSERGADGLPLPSGAVDVSRTLQEIVKPAFLGLANEIHRALIYTASETHGEPVSRIYLLGSLARWKGTDHLLNRLVKLPVETMPDLLQAFGRGTTPGTREQPEPAPETAVATGLALSGMIEDGRY